MKRNILILLCFCLCSYVFGDETKNVTIKANEHFPQEIVIDESCRLQVSAARYQDGVRISVTIENNNEEYPFFIFKRAFTEKDLKRQGIRFDKKSYSLNNRSLITCNSMDGDDAVQIDPAQSGIFMFHGDESNMTDVTIPIYIAKYKNKKKTKFLILQRNEIRLNVKIEAEPVSEDNDDFDRLQEACEELIRDLQKQKFCTHSNHDSSLEEQEQPYREKMNEIKNKIGQIKSAHNWSDQDTAYSRYKDLLCKLDKIDWSKYEVDCGKHRRRRPTVSPQSSTNIHNCTYSTWTVDKVLKELKSLYKRLDLRKISKSEAVEQARAMQREWSNKSCPLFNKMSADSSKKSQIVRCYNAIEKY